MHKEARYVSKEAERRLWTAAAGRCEFAGCNKPLWKSKLTQRPLNIGQKAHIYSFSSNGPRGNRNIPRNKVNDISNLMLVCHECHLDMDAFDDDHGFTADLLRHMKEAHERRIDIVTGVHPDMRSHVVHYCMAIGHIELSLSFDITADALFPERYPADDKAIDLSTPQVSRHDRDEGFYAQADGDLVAQFRKRIRERMADGDIQHISLFALAPQPLLVKLGALLADIPDVDVRQLRREPKTWRWGTRPPDSGFIVHMPKNLSGPPALVLALSANISEDRVMAALGYQATVWTVTIPKPNNDFLRSREQLAEFRTLARDLMVQIKDTHGEKAILNVFPAAPVAIAVELGRVRMPKADLRWRVFDQVNERGDFIPALDIL